MGPGEILLLVALILVLYSAGRLLRLSRSPGSASGGILLWAAQGFGLGRIPWAPGTFGSAGGLLWLILALQLRSLPGFLLVNAGAVAFCVYACGAAERILRQKDPSSVVLDELVAIPVCFLGWILVVTVRNGALPPPDYFFSGNRTLLSFAIVGLFRLFDIAKPWPIRGSQSLPGGWGVTIDDLLAAIYVNAIALPLFALRNWF